MRPRKAHPRIRDAYKYLQKVQAMDGQSMTKADYLRLVSTIDSVEPTCDDMEKKEVAAACGYYYDLNGRLTKFPSYTGEGKPIYISLVDGKLKVGSTGETALIFNKFATNNNCYGVPHAMARIKSYAKYYHKDLRKFVKAIDKVLCGETVVLYASAENRQGISELCVSLDGELRYECVDNEVLKVIDNGSRKATISECEDVIPYNWIECDERAYIRKPVVYLCGSSMPTNLPQIGPALVVLFPNKTQLKSDERISKKLITSINHNLVKNFGKLLVTNRKVTPVRINGNLIEKSARTYWD